MAADPGLIQVCAEIQQWAAVAGPLSSVQPAQPPEVHPFERKKTELVCQWQSFIPHLHPLQ